jgi:hypothetical protein
MDNLDKFIPNDKEIINKLYQDRKVVSVGNLDDLLKLPLNETYANNKDRIATTYKFTELIDNKKSQDDARNIINSDLAEFHALQDANLRDRKIKISTNDIIKE